MSNINAAVYNVIFSPQNFSNNFLQSHKPSVQHHLGVLHWRYVSNDDCVQHVSIIWFMGQVVNIKVIHLLLSILISQISGGIFIWCQVFTFRFSLIRTLLFHIFAILCWYIGQMTVDPNIIMGLIKNNVSLMFTNVLQTNGINYHNYKKKLWWRMYWYHWIVRGQEEAIWSVVNAGFMWSYSINLIPPFLYRSHENFSFSCLSNSL